VILAVGQGPDNKTNNNESRLHSAIEALEALGGSPRIEEHEEKVFIKGGSCPLGVAVMEHPEVCQLAEALVSEIIGRPVKERCEREESPRCCFELVDK
jgi:predicted ArsR family transcriptional regulator